MKKNNITRRLSLRAKFKSTDMVEVCIIDEFNNMQLELIPIRVGTREVSQTISQMETGGTINLEEDKSSEGGKE